MKLAQERRIEAAFTHHPPKNPSQIERYQILREKLKAVAYYLADHCPDSRELNSALKSLEEAQSWAIAAIARNE